MNLKLLSSYENIYVEIFYFWLIHISYENTNLSFLASYENISIELFHFQKIRFSMKVFHTGNILLL